MFHTEVGLLAEDGSVVIKIKGDDSPFQKVLGKIGSAVNTAVKASAAAVGAASAGVAALGTACINAYADYEQLAGGVETLFKDSAETIHSFADNAYKTAGLSANEYMETVTSFSASLLQSLDGDTEKAAAAADLAITDMADNANKMGTAMASRTHIRALPSRTIPCSITSSSAMAARRRKCSVYLRMRKSSAA